MYSSNDINENLLIQTNLKLTKDDYYIAWLLFLIDNDNNDAKNAYQTLRKTFKIATTDLNLKELQYKTIPLTKEGVKRLINCKLFKKLEDKGDNTLYEFNNEEAAKIFITARLAYDEFVDLFRPINLLVQETSYSVVNIDDRKKYKMLYSESINNSLIYHNQIIKICEYAIKNKLVTCGLSKIIETEKWKEWAIHYENNKNKPTINRNVTL